MTQIINLKFKFDHPEIWEHVPMFIERCRKIPATRPIGRLVPKACAIEAICLGWIMLRFREAVMGIILEQPSSSNVKSRMTVEDPEKSMLLGCRLAGHS